MLSSARLVIWVAFSTLLSASAAAQSVLPSSACRNSSVVGKFYGSGNYQDAYNAMTTATDWKDPKSRDQCLTELELRRLYLLPLGNGCLKVDGQYQSHPPNPLYPGPKPHVLEFGLPGDCRSAAQLEFQSTPEGLNRINLTSNTLQAQAPPPPAALIRLAFSTSSLAGSTVSIDGAPAHPKAEGDLTFFEVAAGHHEIKVGHPGRRTSVTKIDVKASDTVVMLDSSTGVSVVAAKSNVSIDGRPAAIVPMTPGHHRITVSLEGRQDWNATLVVPATNTSDLVLEPQLEEKPPATPKPGFVAEYWPAFALGVLGFVAGGVWLAELNSAKDTKSSYDAACQKKLNSGGSCDDLRGQLSDAERARGRSEVAGIASLAFFAVGGAYVTVKLAF